MKKVIATILIATTSLMMVACGSFSGDTKVIHQMERRLPQSRRVVLLSSMRD